MFKYILLLHEYTFISAILLIQRFNSSHFIDEILLSWVHPYWIGKPMKDEHFPRFFPLHEKLRVFIQELAVNFSSRLQSLASSSEGEERREQGLLRAQLPSHRAFPHAWDMVRSLFQTEEQWPSQIGQGLSNEYPPHSEQSRETWSSCQETPHVKHELSCSLSSSIDKTASEAK